MKLKTLSRLGLAGLMLLMPGYSFAWSDSVYRLVIRKAIDTLPKGQKKYFEDHKYELPSLTPDEDAPARPEADDDTLLPDATPAKPTRRRSSSKRA